MTVCLKEFNRSFLIDNSVNQTPHRGKTYDLEEYDMKRYIVLTLLLIFVSTLDGCVNIKSSDKTVAGSAEISNTEQVTEQTQQQSISDDEKVRYNGKEYLKSELSQQTLEWLELPEEKRMLSSYFPPEFMVFEDTWGIDFMAKDITPTNLTLVCTQSGGEPTGELQTDSWFILENWTQENGWKEVQHIQGNRDLAWEDIAYRIPMNDTISWQINWEYIYEKLHVGKYRIGKEVMDFRKVDDFDKVVYYAEFEITK